MKLSRSLIFGGSFDPVHIGHLLVARAAAEAVGAPGVLLLPCAQSPHKQEVAQRTAAAHRLAMLRLATVDDGFFGISTVEMERPPPSYSIDTVQLLMQQGWEDIVWLIGTDQARSLPRWHRSAELMRLVRWVVAGRSGDFLRGQDLPPGFESLAESVVGTPMIEISATEIRSRVRAGRSIRHMVPEAVERYIAEHGLYREG